MTTTTTLSIIPTDLKIGQQVDIESRTWPGINKPGGHATITKLHYDGGGGGAMPTKIDVKYVLGGSEKQIEITYVKPHVELARGGRSRRVDKKMNVESFTASTTTAGGGGSSDGGGEKENNWASGKKKMVKKRKADGNGNLEKNVKKKKVGTTAAAKIEEEQVVVEKDDDDNKKKNKSALPNNEGKKKTVSTAAVAAGTANNNTTKSIASYFTTAAATASATDASDKAKGPSKLKETTKKVKKNNIHPTTNKTKPSNNPTTTKNNKAPRQLVKYSPNSILAVRAAHAKSPAQSHIFGTKTIGLLEGFDIHENFSLHKETATTSSSVRGGGGGNKKKRSVVQESLFPYVEEEKKQVVVEEKRKCDVPLLPGKKVAPSSAATSVSSGGGVSNKDKSVQNHKTMQSLYKNECVKAQDFVKSMFGSATNDNDDDDKKVGEDEDVSSSPESCLELKMDSGRMNLFNSLLSEVMFKKGIDSMDVDEMICSVNTHSLRGDTVKPFTLLEVKAFLQTLDSQNRIFVSWEEDNSGTIYSI